MSENFIHVCTYPGCEARFQRPSKLKVHIRKHTGERPFTCDVQGCNKTYTNESHLRRHKQRTHMKDTIANTKCICPVEECGKVFSNIDNMKRHKANIHDKKDYVCPICNEGFHKKVKLRVHMEGHTGLCEYRCEFCPATFQNRPEYKKHRYNHKTYTCSCGEEFYRWSMYLKHRRTDHMQMHVCKYCTKVFVHKNNYNMHLKTHEEKRTVSECPIEGCGRVYYYDKNLREHIRSFHLKIKKPLPPSKQKLRDARQTNKERKPQKTLTNGRKPRKDRKTIKQSSALKMVGLSVPYDAEKAVLQGNTIEGEVSDSFSYSDFSDMDVSKKVTPGASSASARMSEDSDRERSILRSTLTAPIIISSDSDSVVREMPSTPTFSIEDMQIIFKKEIIDPSDTEVTDKLQMPAPPIPELLNNPETVNY